MPDPTPEFASAVYLQVLGELTTALVELKVAIDRYDEHGEVRHKILDDAAARRHAEMSGVMNAVTLAVQPLVSFAESEQVRREVVIAEELARREAQAAVDLIELAQENVREDKLLDAEISRAQTRTKVIWGVLSALGLAAATGITSWIASFSQTGTP